MKTTKHRSDYYLCVDVGRGACCNEPNVDMNYLGCATPRSLPLSIGDVALLWRARNMQGTNASNLAVIMNHGKRTVTASLDSCPCLTKPTLFCSLVLLVVSNMNAMCPSNRLCVNCGILSIPTSSPACQDQSRGPPTVARPHFMIRPNLDPYDG